jgi:hypothetical protein
MIGRRAVPRPENNLTPEQIIHQLQYAGVDEALVVHSFSKEYDPLVGNEKISDICAQHPNLHACYAVLPHYTGEMPTGGGLLKYLQNGNAQAVRMYPLDHGYVFGETWCGALFSTFEEAGIPVFVDFEQTNWTEIDAVLQLHKRLRLVVVRPTYRINRWIFPLLEKHQTLRFEISFYDAHFGIETITERFGSERMLFGTAFPEYDPGAMISLVQYSKISELDKEKIGSRNLESILWQVVK